MAEHTPHSRFVAMMESPSAKAILAEFFQDRLQKTTEALVNCNETQFLRQQGRAQELQSLLALCSK